MQSKDSSGYINIEGEAFKTCMFERSSHEPRHRDIAGHDIE